MDIRYFIFNKHMSEYMNWIACKSTAENDCLFPEMQLLSHETFH